MSLFKNIRFYIITASFLLSVAIYLYSKTTTPESIAQTVKLSEIFGLISILYLYVALLATPLTRFFPSLPYRGKYIFMRRAIGVSAFYFACLHTFISFFYQLGGFAGLGFLDNRYILAIILALGALLIYGIMAATSLDYMIDKLTFFRWKVIHRFTYLASILVLVHFMLLGTHYADLTGILPQISFVAITFLLILESFRFDSYLRTKWETLPNFGLSFGFVLILITAAFLVFYSPQSASNSSPIGIHSNKMQMPSPSDSMNMSSMFNGNLPPSMVGDKTKRYTVSFLHPNIVEASRDATLSFQVYDASSGNFVDLFSNVYSKLMHLIIVDSELEYFNHIHPDQKSNGFTITTQFPHPGVYHLYENFQPLGAIEQQTAQMINVGAASPSASRPSTQLPDSNFTKTFGNYDVTLDFPKPLLASQLTNGGQKMTFTIEDANTHQPVTTLKPYLAAFGHLVMINEKTYDYLHVHPTNLVPPADNANGGPVVEFLPMGIYAPIKPGIYRVFAQFNPDNNLFTADFTVEVK
jgi:DMSO/TMAO reductase YedYZ heme-binding membrane subunit